MFLYLIYIPGKFSTLFGTILSSAKAASAHHQLILPYLLVSISRNGLTLTSISPLTAFLLQHSTFYVQYIRCNFDPLSEAHLDQVLRILFVPYLLGTIR